MKGLGVKAWALIASIAAFLFGMGSPARGESPGGDKAVPSVKEPSVRKTPLAPAATVPGIKKPIVRKTPPAPAATAGSVKEPTVRETPPAPAATVPSIKEPAARMEPLAPPATVPGVKRPTPRMKSQMHPSLFAPPEAVVTVISYGATHSGMGLDRKTFSVRGPWNFMPDGSLRQTDKLGRVMIVKESGEVIVYDASRRQVEKRRDTAAVQFYRVMKRTEDLRLKQGR